MDERIFYMNMRINQRFPTENWRDSSTAVIMKDTCYLKSRFHLLLKKQEKQRVIFSLIIGTDGGSAQIPCAAFLLQKGPEVDAGLFRELLLRPATPGAQQLQSGNASFLLPDRFGDVDKLIF